MKLNEYIKQEEEKLAGQKQDLSFLKKTKYPLEVSIQEDGIALYSTDYSLATNFFINKKRKDVTDRQIFSRERYQIWKYPQFYFVLKDGQSKKEFNVLIKDENLDAVAVSIAKEIENWEEFPEIKNNDRDTVINYFKKKKVKSELLNKLKDNWEKLQTRI